MPARLSFFKVKAIISNYFTYLQAIEINLYHLHSVKMQKISENIFIRSLKFMCTLHCNIYQTQFPGKETSYYRQLFLILVVAKFNICKATFEGRKARFNIRQIQCPLKLAPLK